MTKKLTITAALLLTGTLTLAHAAGSDAGKALFESPTLGGGSTGKSCVTCHAGGKNLGADLFTRKTFTVMGQSQKTLADVVNLCIEKPLGGKAIDPQGQEMTDLLAYMQTLLGKPAKKAAAPKKVEGC